MANCRIIRNKDGIIEKVFASNGEESILYKNLLGLVNNLADDKFTDLQNLYKQFQEIGIIKGLSKSEIALAIYNRIHSPNFFNFFGDWVNDPENSSKVVDKNGEPLIVYHGTSSQFEEFKKENIKREDDLRLGKGFYFTNKINEAADWATDYAYQYEGETSSDVYRRGLIMPVFLNIRENKKDGIIDESVISKNTYGEYVAFNPNQIKSIFNKGDFSSSSNVFSTRTNEPSAFNYSGFTKEVGLNRKQIDTSKKAKINKAVQKYNQKHGTSYYIKWAQVGQSNLETWNIIDNKPVSSKKEFDSAVDFSVSKEDKELNHAKWLGLWNFYSDRQKISKSNDVLKRIADDSTYLGLLANKLLQHNHNNVDILFLTREELNDYIDKHDIRFYEGVSVSNVEGFYDHNTNQIVMVDKPTGKLAGNLLEEIIHALTVQFIKHDENEGRKWKELYLKVKEEFSKEGKDNYYFTNEYEFLAGVLRDGEFQKLLAGKPSNSTWFLNYFHELFNHLLDLMTKVFGLNFNERTLLYDVYEAGSRVIVQSARRADDFSGLKSDAFEYVSTTLTDEQREIMRDEISYLSEELNKEYNKPALEKITNELYEAYSKRLKKIEDHRSYKDIKELFKGEKVSRYKAITDQLEKASQASATPEGLARKARAIASAIVQTSYLLDITAPHIKDIIRDKDAVENIHTLQYYLYTLSDWEITFNEAKELIGESNPAANRYLAINLDKIENIYKDIAKNDETGMVEALKPILVPAGEKFIEWAEREEATVESIRDKAVRRGDTDSAEVQSKRLLDLRAAKERVDFNNDKAIIKFLKGQMGDTNVFSMYLESFRDSPDPIVGGFTAFIKRNLDEIGGDIATMQIHFEQELAPIYKQLGGRFDAESLGKEITFEDKRVDGQGVEYTVPAFLNPFKNYKADEKLFKNAIYSLEEKVNDKTITPEEEQQLIEKKKEYARWRVSSLHNPFVDEFYKKYELWDDEIGQLLKLDVDRIFSEVDKIQEPHIFIGSELSQDELDQIDALYKEYFYLGNITNLDGSAKTGIELQKALRMKEMRALNVKFYEWVDNIPAFEKAKLDHQETLISSGILEGSIEFRDAMYKWEEDNTRSFTDPAYYAEREGKIRKLKILMSRATDAKLKESILAPLYKELIDQVYGLRDEDGQPVGSEISASKTKRLKEVQEQIEAEREKFTGISGLNDDEKERLSELYDKKYSEGLNTAEEEEFNNLIAQSDKLGMHKKDRAEIISLFTELRNMQSRVPTPYYVESFNNNSSRLGITLDDRGNIQEGADFISILDSSKLFRLLDDPQFRTWFEANHIQVLRWDKDSGGKIPKWERLYQWSKVVPSNPDYIKRRPAYKYSYRRVKDEYRTERIVGKTVDIKGDWLPKTVEEGGSVDYRNEKFYALKESAESGNQRNKLIYQYLQTNLKYHFKVQDGIPNVNKLGYDLPKVRKETSARNLDLLKKPLELPGLMWARFVDYLRSLREYNTDSGNFEEVDGELVSNDYQLVYADKYGTELNSIPMKYITRMDAENVSLNTPRSIMKYAYAAATNKKLIEISPIARTLQRVLDNPINAPIDVKKKIRGNTKQSPILGSNRRKEAVDFIIKREFEGYQKAYELGKFADSMVSLLKRLGSWSYLKFNIPSSIANVVNAVNQNWITAGQGFYSSSDFAMSATDMFSRFIPAWQSDYWINELGTKSLEGQMAERWEFMQSSSIEEEAGEKFGASILKDFAGFNWMFNHREWGEYYVQSRIWLAYLNGTKVEQTLPDGSLKTLALKDIYELDDNGVIKLKDGVSEDWGFKGEEFLKLKNTIQKTIRNTHGAYANFDKSMAEQYTAYNFALFLKKWFISMFMQRFSASNVKVSKGGITSTPRFNTDAGYQWGYYMAGLNAASKQWQTGLNNWADLTAEEKASLWRIGHELMVVLAASFIIRIIAGIDYDDKDPYKSLKDMNWWELQMLYQVMRLQVETETYVSPTQYADFTLQFMAFEAAKKWGRLLIYIITQEEYKRKTGDYKKGDKKWKAQFQRATGLQGISRTFDKPEDLVKSYDKNIRPHI